MPEDLKVTSLPKHILKLESPEGFQTWKRDIRIFLTAARLWSYTTAAKKEPPSQDTDDPDSDFEVREAAWELGHQQTVNIIQFCLGLNYINDFEAYTNAAFLWTAICTTCKPRGSGTLNDLYAQLLQLELAHCKDVPDYIAQFKKLLNDIYMMSTALKLETNLVIYLFHRGLGRKHDAYFTNYTQTHEALKDKENGTGQEPAFTLEYATNRFLNTVRNPTLGTGQSFAAQTYLAHDRHPGPKANALVVTVAPQAVAVDDTPDSQWIRKLVRYCTNCRRNYHSSSECAQRGGHRSGKSSGRAGRGSGGGRGGSSSGGGNSSFNKKKRKHDDDDSEPEAYPAEQKQSKAKRESYVAMRDLGSFAASSAQPERWGLDTCNSQHIVKDRSLFTHYRELQAHETFKIGGLGGPSSPMGIGTIEAHFDVQGEKHTLELKDVLYLPSSPINLVSMGQIARNNCHHKFVTEGDKFGIAIGSNGITAWLATNNLYYLAPWTEHRAYVAPAHLDGHLTTSPDVPPAGAQPNLSADVEADVDELIDSERTTHTNKAALKLWHARMGHLGEDNIKRLANISEGMDLSQAPISNDVCDVCALTKLKSEPHKCPIRPGRFHLDLIHSDIMGPFSDEEVKQYVVTFLDDWSKHLTIDIVDSRDQYLRSFEKFRQMNEHGDFTIHRIRSDNEFNSGEIAEWRAQHGIAWEPTTRGTPQQNGTSERINQTLTSMTRAMLQGATLDWDSWWREVMQAAVYLRNRAPVAGRSKTPYELVTGTPPRLKHIKTIGTKGYALNLKPSTGWKKHQNRSSPCTLLGFHGDHQYYVYLHDAQRVVKVSQVQWGQEPHAPEPVHHHDDSNEGENDQLPSSVDPMDVDTDPITVSTFPSTPRSRPQVQTGQRAIAVVVPRRSTPSVNTPSTPGMDTPITQGSASPPSVPASSQTPEQGVLGKYPMLQERQLSPGPLGLFPLACAISVEPYIPKGYASAMKDADFAERWRQAMQDEVDSLLQNETWTLVDTPKNRSVLRGRWVYALKRGPTGEITRFKGRWVVRGFEQRQGLDYNETFASVVKPMSYKAIFALAAAHDWELEQMDVKTAFLYGSVKEGIYVEQPEGFAKGNKVCKLNKALYGLKQSPRVWYETFAIYMEEQGFLPIDADSGVFIHYQNHTLIALYVDDILVTGPSNDGIHEIKEALKTRFQMSDLGQCKYYLGMTITRDRPNRVIRLGQSAYVQRVLRQFRMDDSVLKATPMETSAKLEPAEADYTPESDFLAEYQSAVGSLMYAMLGTRPDIAFAVGVVSRFAAKPKPTHWNAVKRILRYLKGIVNYQLTFQGGVEHLKGYTDSDWAGDTATRRSTSGYIFNIGSAPLSWSSKRQPTVALSSCEAEFFGQTQAAKEAIWLRELLKELSPEDGHPKTVVLYGDNQGAIALSKDPLHHPRTKHVAIQLKWQ